MPSETKQDPSEGSSSPEDSTEVPAQSPKRSATEAGLSSNGTRPAKAIKRRASKACQSCRSRKVRCNVVEHGPPCTNCRLDEVDCVVSESKRKKKWTAPNAEAASKHPSAVDARKASTNSSSAQAPRESLSRIPEHVAHAPCSSPVNTDALAGRLQVHMLTELADPDPPARDLSSSSSSTRLPMNDVLVSLQKLGRSSTSVSPSITQQPTYMSTMPPPITPSYSLPLYIKPLPSRLGLEDILYLDRKGALAIPPTPMRDELLRTYVEYVHPYMPLLNIHDLVTTIDIDDGASPVSLLLFQSIMFSATAFVDIRHLKRAGYQSRRDARRDFFQKTRLLYDFDIEADRIALIQALLLMTYWYETPDDQKDSHHWMGIAVSLSHTIGLHRNTEKSTAMDASRKGLWKRIWWSTYMRDRLIALGMRRPTRIKDADFDVPMLTVDDFEDALLPAGPSCIPADCKVLRDAETQRRLAIMCIEKAKLCICMSHVLSVQYSVLSNNHGVLNEEGSTMTTVRLSAKKRDPEVIEVQMCDKELQEWKQNLPVEAQYVTPTYQDLEHQDHSIVLNRSLLFMIYYATLSALHRPQVLPSNAVPPRQLQAEMLEHSRKSVRLAASEITNMANALFSLNMTRFLPTTGITVLLPAIIIHLLDIKAPDEATRRASLQGFCQCMQVLGKLRDIYAAADYSTAFLEAAIRKAEISLPQKPDEVKETRNVITSTQGLVDAGRRIGLLAAPSTIGTDSGALTPPPDDGSSSSSHPPRGLHYTINGAAMDVTFAPALDPHLASTPPDSDHRNSSEPHVHLSQSAEVPYITIPQHQPEIEPEFDTFINLDAAGDVLSLDEGAFAAMSGESGGFTMDMDWLKGMKEDGLDLASAMDED